MKISKIGLWAGSAVFALVPLAGCGSEDQDEGTRGNGGGARDCSIAGCVAPATCEALPTGGRSCLNPDGSQGNFGNGDGMGGGGNGFPVPMDLNPNGVEITNSFIWIANSSEGTVSKIDTRTLVELGRYITSPTGSGMPSRTSVAASGAVAVANRGGTGGGAGAGAVDTCMWDPNCTPMAGGGGAGTETGVTKIWANEEECVDSNNNGVIDTSTSATDIKAWGEDECVAWHTVIPEWSNRPLAWAPPTGPDSELEMVWTAGATNCVNTACSWNVYRLNGDTGAIDATINFSGYSGTPFVGPGVISNYGPYGGASDSGGNFWGFSGNTMHLFRVDALTLEKLDWPIPGANGYGLTIDSKGRIFLCGVGGVTRFDPTGATFMTGSGGPALGYNGCMTDGAGTLWVGGGVDMGTAGLHSYDTETLAFKATHAVGAVKGVSIDVDGMVWGVGGAGAFGGPTGGTSDRAFKLNPVDGSVETFMGLVGAYSYSDMTGFGLAQAGYVPVTLE